MLLIRHSQLKDRDGLVEILYDTFESTWVPNIDADAAHAFREEDRPARYVKERANEFWVAEISSSMVGFVDWQDDFVNALHVRSSHSRSGIGTMLMDKAEAEIARSGHAVARLETDTFNERSRAFYKSRSYLETVQYPDKEWNSDLTTILLVKALT